MKQTFKTKRFNEESLLVIARANDICEAYAKDGYDLTLRQLYYQFVSRNWLTNTERSYKRLASIISDARLAGLIDWDHLVDRLRTLYGQRHWDSPSALVRHYSYMYHVRKWEDMKHRVEVWVEKEALSSVIARPAAKWDVDYFACKGYVSQSFMYRAARRFYRYYRDGLQPVVLYLGDHDPSGMQMTEDVEDRLTLMSGGASIIVERLALNMNQVEQYDPPENPAKLSDTRAKAYIAEYGDKSWELDALTPQVIEDLIEKKILDYLEKDIWDENKKKEEEQRQMLHDAADEMDRKLGLLDDEEDYDDDDFDADEEDW